MDQPVKGEAAELVAQHADPVEDDEPPHVSPGAPEPAPFVLTVEMLVTEAALRVQRAWRGRVARKLKGLATPGTHWQLSVRVGAYNGGAPLAAAVQSAVRAWAVSAGVRGGRGASEDLRIYRLRN